MYSYRIYVAGVDKPFVVKSENEDLSFYGPKEWEVFGDLKIRVASVVAVEKISDESPPAVAGMMTGGGERTPDFSHP